MSTSEAEVIAIRQHPYPTVGLPEPSDGSLYALLLRQIKNAGLLERRTGYYVWRIAVTAVLLAAGWTAFVLVGDSWWQLAVAVLLAFVFTQLGFLGHEARHKQISASRRVNDIIGLLHGDLAIGLSFGWWVDKHNRHHAHPNTEGMDPDIETGALAFTAGQAGTWGPVARFVYRYQAFLFFPLLLEAFNLHVGSVRTLHVLPYCETGLVDSYAQALRHLHTVGRTPRPVGDEAMRSGWAGWVPHRERYRGGAVGLAAGGGGLVMAATALIGWLVGVTGAMTLPVGRASSWPRPRDGRRGRANGRSTRADTGRTGWTERRRRWCCIPGWRRGGLRRGGAGTRSRQWPIRSWRRRWPRRCTCSPRIRCRRMPPGSLSTTS